MQLVAFELPSDNGIFDPPDDARIVGRPWCPHETICDDLSHLLRRQEAELFELGLEAAVNVHALVLGAAWRMVDQLS